MHIWKERNPWDLAEDGKEAEQCFLDRKEVVEAATKFVALP